MTEFSTPNRMKKKKISYLDVSVCKFKNVLYIMQNHNVLIKGDNVKKKKQKCKLLTLEKYPNNI